ncbi:MAG: 2-dehydropantoate 2-reductase N-terminal domain-containing protein [Candidatus Dormiibacterota bacterium]
MRFTVVGCGAIGSAIGGHLVSTGHAVQFVEKDPDRVSAIAESGLSLQKGSATTRTRVDIREPKDVDSPLGIVLLAVKAQDTQACAEWCASRLDPEAYIVSLQNGLCEETIASLVGPERTVGAFVNFSAEVLELGLVHYVAPETFAVAVGELDGRLSPRLTRFASQLDSFAPILLTDNIWGFLWCKLGYANMLFATGITPETMADVIEGFPELMVELACEIYDVAKARGVRLEPFDNVRPEVFYPREARDSDLVGATIAKLVAHRRRNAMSRSGVWRDLAVRHVETEVDSQLGVVIAIGEECGLELPLTRALVGMVHEIESGTRPMDLANVEQLEQLRQRASIGPRV